MTWRSVSAALLGCALPAAAGAPLQAQRVREFGVHAAALASDPAVVVGGFYGAIRVTSRTRVAATVAAGGTGGRLIGRAELAGHFLLNPRSTTRPELYGGAGAALSAAGGHTAGFVMVLLGLEARPGAPNGWAIEAGFGGGFRVAAGWRWRWMRHK